MDEVNKSRIQEIEERVKAATPGEWFTHESADWHDIEILTDKADGDEDAILEVVATVGESTDAELIANAPADLRFLIAEVERLQKYEHAYIELTRELASPLASVEFLRRTNARLHEEGVSPDGATWGSDSGKAQA